METPFDMPASLISTKHKPSLRDTFGKVSSGLPSETIDNCIRLHLQDHDQFPIIGIYSRQDQSGNAIDDDNTLAEVAKRIEINWNTNAL